MVIFTPSQKILTGNPSILYGGGGQGVSILIYNPDKSNTVYLSYDAGVYVGSSSSIPLGPGQSVTIDGSRSIYGVAPSGTAATVIIPGGSSFFQPTTLDSLGGISVFIQASAPTGTIPVNSIWLQTSGGVVVGFYTWDGSTWVQQSFNADDIISAGTIVANLIAAGTVVAGIVNGTTINAGTFTGSVFEGTDFIINSSGAFFYSAAPAAGKLIASVTNNNGTDSFGNAYLDGFTSYSGSGSNWFAFNAFGNGLEWFTATSSAGPWTADSPLNSAVTYVTGGGVGIGGNVIELNGAINGALTALEPGTPNTEESWHNMTLQNSWSASGRHARYRLLPDGNVQIDLEISGGTITNNTVVWTAPAGYVPSGAPGTQHLGMDVLSGATATQFDTPRFDMQTNGNLIVENIPTGTTIIGVSAIYSLT